MTFSVNISFIYVQALFDRIYSSSKINDATCDVLKREHHSLSVKELDEVDLIDRRTCGQCSWRVVVLQFELIYAI